jgi:hypothetical protein
MAGRQRALNIFLLARADIWRGQKTSRKHLANHKRKKPAQGGF